MLDIFEDEDMRQVLLETATLWLGALVGSRDQHGDWLTNVMTNDVAKHPDYAMRVWYLNGRFSSQRRQGVIAHEITKQVEALARCQDPYADDAAFQASPELFARLWGVAVDELRRGA